MSKSVKRVQQALSEAGITADIVEVGQARTAAEAAEAAGCHVHQIAKSIIFQDQNSGHVVLFLTAGGNRVSSEKASAVAGATLGKADADLIRAETGFAIGGVAPVGHLVPIRAYWDPKLSEFDTIWAAAGTPRHIFPIAPKDLLRITGATPADFTV
ncbi:YbaK/EbsC family protein [Paracoccus pacificus]|uniref:YbaK/EbsC family protein n=1 Tax=Paracoccus pacificus TaxID=1463598 RepID=A0ABW4R1P8_9RHOB